MLPDGFTERPLALADAPAVTAVMAAAELEDLGEVFIEEADIVSDWQRPSFDLGGSTVGVFEGDRLLAELGYRVRWNSWVLQLPAGVVVGMAFVLLNGPIAYIDKLAVRRDLRGRGLAQAVLAEAFAVGRAHGATVSELATDSRTGALSLMRRSTWSSSRTGSTAAIAV